LAQHQTYLHDFFPKLKVKGKDKIKHLLKTLWRENSMGLLSCFAWLKNGFLGVPQKANRELIAGH
jgi:hypothetical protein